MFCPKCGSKALDGATFCQKCGAKLIVDDAAQQAPTSTPVRQTQPSTQNVSSDTPKKKKSKKLPIILGAVTLVIVAVIVIAVSSNQDGVKLATSDSKGSTADSLSETYTNQAEGISFKYPNFWEEGILSESGVYFSDDSMTMIMYLLAPTVDGPKIPVMNIRKAPVTQDVIDSVFSATLSTLMPAGNMMATEIEDVAVGDLPGRKFTFATKANDGGDLTYIRYIYFINSLQYRIEFYGTTKSLKDIDNLLKNIMDSYTITAANSSGESGTENSSEGGQSMQWKVAYTNKVRELAAQNDELQFALIDLTESDIPALVADYSGYYVSVFIWADETLVTVMEDWAYGAMGNHGYEYLPGGNVIRNQNSDQAGAIVYESYMKVNDAHEVVNLYDETLSFWFFKDTNGNGTIDENEPFSEEPYYYYGNTEISKEEYDTYRIPGEYERITGDKSAEEIISQLNGENVSDSITTYEVLYKGIPVIPLLESSIDDIMALLGKPTDEGQYLQGYFYDYNNEILFILDADKRNISWIEISPEALTVDDVSLDKDRAFLIKTFGEPTEEYIDEMTREYTISYNIKKYRLAFILADSSSKVSKVTIHFSGQ